MNRNHDSNTFCPKCGCPLSSKIKFCHECGYENPNYSETNKCQECNSNISPTDSTCPKCGCPVENNSISNNPPIKVQQERIRVSQPDISQSHENYSESDDDDDDAKTNKSIIRIACIAGGILLLSVIIYFMLGSSKSSVSDDDTNTTATTGIPTEINPDNPNIKYVLASKLRIRTSPNNYNDSNISSRIAVYGDRVEIIGSSGDWYQINSSSRYVNKKFLCSENDFIRFRSIVPADYISNLETPYKFAIIDYSKRKGKLGPFEYLLENSFSNSNTDLIFESITKDRTLPTGNYIIIINMLDKGAPIQVTYEVNDDCYVSFIKEEQSTN